MLNAVSATFDMAQRTCCNIGCCCRVFICSIFVRNFVPQIGFWFLGGVDYMLIKLIGPSCVFLNWSTVFQAFWFWKMHHVFFWSLKAFVFVPFFMSDCWVLKRSVTDLMQYLCRVLAQTKKKGGKAKLVMQCGFTSGNCSLAYSPWFWSGSQKG